MAQKHRHSDSGDSDSDSPQSSDSDYSPSPKKKVKRPNPQPATKASIAVLATDVTPSQTCLEKIDADVLVRIKKALALATHAGTGEQEAKAALRMASKLMARYSVTQADVLAHESDAQKLERAGHSVVSILSTKENQYVKFETWASDLSSAMKLFFDCQTYSQKFRGNRVQFTFYGLAEQTVAAAYAMEMSYNLIVAWALAKVSNGVHKKNAYKRGVAYGLIKLAQKEKGEEKQKAVLHEQKLLEQKQKVEEEEDKRRLARLQDPGDAAEDLKVKRNWWPETDVSIKAEEGPAAGSSKVTLEATKETLKEMTVKLEETTVTLEERKGNLQKAKVQVEETTLPAGAKVMLDETNMKLEETEVALEATKTRLDETKVKLEETEVKLEALKGRREVKVEEVMDEDHPLYHAFPEPEPMRCASPAHTDDSDGMCSDRMATADFDDSDPDDFNFAPELSSPSPDTPLPPASLSMPPPPPPAKADTAAEEESQWGSVNQLVAFRETSVAIGNDYLKAQGIKVGKGRHLPSLKLKDEEAGEAYKQGVEDAKKIDVRGRRLKGAEHD